MYKSSTLAQVAGRATSGFSLSIDGVEEPGWILDVSEPRQSRQDGDAAVRDGLLPSLFLILFIYITFRTRQIITSLDSPGIARPKHRSRFQYG